MTKVVKDLKDTKKYCGTARPFLSISFAVSIPLLLVRSNRWFLYGKDSWKASLQKWEDTLAFLLLIMTFPYASVTLQSKKYCKRDKDFQCNSWCFSLHFPPLEVDNFKNRGITEMPKIWSCSIVVNYVWRSSQAWVSQGREYLLADQVIFFNVRKYCLSWQALLLVENWNGRTDTSLSTSFRRTKLADKTTSDRAK